MAALLLGAATAAWVLVVASRWRPPPSRLLRRDDEWGAPRPRSSPTFSRPGGLGAGTQHDRRTVVLLAGSAVAALAWPPALALGVVAAAARPHLARRRRRRLEQRAIAEALPDAIDLLALAVSAGQTPVLAVRTLAEYGPLPVGPAFGEVVRRVELGQRFADALDELDSRLGLAAEPLRAALVASDRYGVALGPTLDQLAVDARRERRRLAEIAARKLPVRLSFPLVGCILPAFALLTLVPLLAGAVGSLRL